MTREECDLGRLVIDPLVSVLMITYNHAEYLAEAIEGVLNQECDFPFELIIGEDASKDATLEVALDYQKRFPDIIRRSEEHTSELQSLMRHSYAVFCLKKKKK